MYEYNTESSTGPRFTDMFQALSSFHQLLSLRLVLASPTVYTSLPSDTGLIASYRQAAEAILLHVSATNLRRIVVSFEPGLGTPDYLSGARKPVPPSSESSEQSRSSPSSSAEEPEPKWWSYGSQRSTALETLLTASLDHVIAGPDPDASVGQVNSRRFAALRMLGVRVWDGKGGKDDAWWLGEVSKALPTVHTLRLLRFEVKRDWPDDELLWSDA
ncbi:hypothetical protein K466DRAFT_388748 [Polyporus arcularius HHB13444]|uniref:Uncharacterized protein n=1 Tax=Polyporus arcularius HHB13444 TaxID=1314778 RepID=A0A5C3PKS3_9APHY|nr:hypothetical protein K466DRAFT_388748 [Polyporus arcularius HHB13444]